MFDDNRIWFSTGLMLLAALSAAKGSDVASAIFFTGAIVIAYLVSRDAR